MLLPFASKRSIPGFLISRGVFRDLEENRDLEKDNDEAKGVFVSLLPACPQVDRSKHSGLLLGLMQPR